MSDLPFHWKEFSRKVEWCKANRAMFNDSEIHFITNMHRQFENAQMALDMVRGKGDESSRMEDFFNPSARQLNWLRELAERV